MSDAQTPATWAEPPVPVDADETRWEQWLRLEALKVAASIGVDKEYLSNNAVYQAATARYTTADDVCRAADSLLRWVKQVPR